MKINNPIKLSSSCVQSATKRIFDSLIDIEDELSMQRIIRDFIVNACLPKSLLLRVIRLLLVYLDRGYNSTPIVEDNGETGESARTRTCVMNGTVNNLGRRQRSVAIMKAIIHYTISRWGDKPLLPQHFLQDDNISTRTLSLRGRQTVVMHTVESFVWWSDVMASADTKCCTSCTARGKWPNPPKILNLQAEHGNWSGTRTALAAISSIIKSDISNCGVFDSDNKICFICHENKISQSSDIFYHNYKRSVIKLDVVLMGSIQDWVVDVLLFVLRNSSSKGFDIEISSIRSEDVDLYKIGEILRSLRMPEKVRSLELRMKEPKSIFTASHVLRTLAGLQSFTFAHLWRRATQRTEFTTDESFRLKSDILNHWEELSKIRLEGIVVFSDFTNPSSEDRCNEVPNMLSEFLNPNVQFLECAYDSLSEPTLDWLLHCEENSISKRKECYEQVKKCPRVVVNKNIHTLRFDSESLLSTSSRSFNKFLQFLKKNRESAKTLSIDHCGLKEDQAKKILSLLVDTYPEQSNSRNNASTYGLPLEHFTFREKAISAEFASTMFESLCSAARNRILPNFTYFGILTPKRSDVFWRGRSPQKVNTDNWMCPFEVEMNNISKLHHCTHVYCDVFWEPSEDDAL